MFELTINQIISMFAFILIGYLLRHFKQIPDTASKSFSRFLVNVCMPALVFQNCAENMTVEKVSEQGVVVGLGIIVLLTAYILACFLSVVFAKDDFERRVYTYSFTIPNIGYMGVPLVGAVFGSEILFTAIMFVFPWYIFIYSKGISMLSSYGKNNKKGIKDVLLQPTILAIIAGSLIGLMGIKLPTVIKSITASAANCSGTIAMIITGIVIAERPLIGMINDFRVYIASVIRLVIIPFTAYFVMSFCNLDKTIIIAATVMLSMPLGLNTVVFPESYGGDGSKGASLALISHTMSLITIPIIFNLIK